MIQTQLLKLERPYTLLMCGGEVGWHIATLIVAEEAPLKDGSYGIRTHSHPVVSYRSSVSKDRELMLSPSEGVVWDKAELAQCTALCREDDRKVRWSAILGAAALEGWGNWDTAKVPFEVYDKTCFSRLHHLRRTLQLLYGVEIIDIKDARVGIELMIVPTPDGRNVATNPWLPIPALPLVFYALMPEAKTRTDSPMPLEKRMLTSTFQELSRQAFLYKDDILLSHDVTINFSARQPALQKLVEKLNKEVNKDVGKVPLMKSIN